MLLLTDIAPLAATSACSSATCARSTSNDGSEIIFEITMAPGAMGPPRHSHPAQDESWTVETGELSLLVNDEWRTVAAGESPSIPAGTVHTLANRSAVTVRFHDAHRPLLDFQEYIEDLDRLTRSGKLSTRMTPRTPVLITPERWTRGKPDPEPFRWELQS